MLRLRPYKNGDAKYIVSWLKDEITFRKWCADRYQQYPISVDDMNAYYAGYADSDNFYEMTAFDEEGVAGHLIMRFMDEKKEILRFGFIIVNDQVRGKGYGKEMLRLALQYAFDILKVKKVTIGVFENNEAAYRCYQSVGFQKVQSENQEVFHILGETWNCVELEIENKNL